MRTVLLQPLARDGLQLFAYLRIVRGHALEVLAANANEFDMIQSRAGCGSPSASEQSNFAEELATAQIGQHQIAAAMFLRHFHKSDSDQVEAVRQVALAEDDIAFG